MDPKTMQILKEWRENMRQAQAMEFALVAEEQYKNARDVKKIRAEMRAYREEYFMEKNKNKKSNRT